MKVQLTVVQGKPEGKVIPLGTPTFKIGRGDTCHLRPNSEQVSREHAELSVSDGQVAIRDLKSRNGTFVNGKRVTENIALKDADLIQIGPLTFSISIQGAPARTGAVQPAPTKTSDIDKVPDEDIDSWLVADSSHNTPATKSGVYDGATGSFESLRNLAEQNAAKPAAAPAPATPAPAAPVAKPVAKAAPVPAPVPVPAPAPAPVSSPATELDVDAQGSTDYENESESEDEPPPTETMEWVDESNPFHQKKKPQAEAAPAAASKANFKDSADAAGDILRRMMERRRAKS